MKTHKSNRGVTLVEIAIVLVIIGLLLGGVLKGQELINNARIRAIADQQLGMQVAWNAFQERYQAIPGDFARAQRYIKQTVNGPGRGIIASPVAGGAGEMLLALNHLTESGLLRCSECGLTQGEIGLAVPLVNATAINATGATGSPRGLRNTYGGVMGIFHNAAWYQIDTEVGARDADNSVLLSHTGPLVPSNILSEVDLKIDDGFSNSGSFRYTEWTPTAANPAGLANANQIGQCTNLQDDSTPGGLNNVGRALWRSASRAPATFANCSGVLYLQ